MVICFMASARPGGCAVWDEKNLTWEVLETAPLFELGYFLWNFEHDCFVVRTSMC